MINYSPQQKEAIKKEILKRLDKAFEVNSFGQGTPLWKNLIFMLDTFNQGNYYGTLSVKFMGTSCADVKEVERTHKLGELYKDP